MAGIHHVGLAVDDLDAAVAMYSDSLGARLVSRGRSDSESMDYALLDVGGSELELMSSDRPDSALGKFLAKRGPGLHHVAYEVDDVTRRVLELAQSGYEIVGTVRTGVHGTKVAFVHPKSMGGVLTELVERHQ